MAIATGYAGVPITTHQWLQPLYSWLGGKSRSPTGLAPMAIRSATGAMGFYGNTGIKQPTGLGTTGSGPGGGVTGSSFFDLRSNGGTGTNFYTFTDIVNILKKRGDIAT